MTTLVESAPEPLPEASCGTAPPVQAGRAVELTRLLRTVRHLRARQVVARVRLRAQTRVTTTRAVLDRLLPTAQVTAAGWPEGLRPFDARSAMRDTDSYDVSTGTVRLLGGERQLASPQDWAATDASRLWRFHLHYWDWAWALADSGDSESFARLFCSWSTAALDGCPDAWSAYPVALRAWSWCGQFTSVVRGTPLEGAFVRELVRHRRFLELHLERDLEGNHLLKDLKALVGLSVFFGRSDQVRRRLGQLQRQVSRQVLADGGHYERSPAYHVQVLTDLDDLVELLTRAGERVPEWLPETCTRMRDWLRAVVLPDGTLPMLNDGYPVRPADLELLGVQPQPADGIRLLPESGYAVLRRAGVHVLVDCGRLGPDEQPGHGHADTLSFLCYVDGRPVLVDPGTSTYSAGAQRTHERSTAAHTTLCLAGQDSSEVWGAFRVGRRASVTVLHARETAGGLEIEAEHDGYRHLPGRPVHRRRWRLTDDGLQITDRLVAAGGDPYTAAVTWLLDPDVELELDATRSPVLSTGGTRLSIDFADGGAVAVRAGTVATGHGRVRPTAALVHQLELVSGHGITTTVRRTTTPSDGDAAA